MPLFIYENFVEYNVNKIREITKKDIIAVVKSDAYGLGVDHIIPLLKNAKVNIFAFETYQEYEKSAKNLVNSKVLIMENINVQNVLKSPDNVIFSINSLKDALLIKDIKKRQEFHLRVDTGMNRLGIRSIYEFKKVLELLEANEFIKIKGLYTHFSSGLLEEEYYQKQLKTFKKYLKIKDFEIVHANATKSLHKELIGNMIRVGMALYGYHQPFLGLKRTLSLIERPCSIFKTKHVDKIGYFQKNSQGSVVGVLTFGYNDINLDNIEYIYRNGKKYQLLGKSCMNHTHFYADEDINYLSWMSILPTNDIISSSDDYKNEINWYHILTSLKSMPKNFIRTKELKISRTVNGDKLNLKKLFIKIK